MPKFDDYMDTGLEGADRALAWIDWFFSHVGERLKKFIVGSVVLFFACFLLPFWCIGKVFGPTNYEPPNNTRRELEGSWREPRKSI